MIVSNTTPLINFSSICRLDILQQLFKQITIPKAVEKELMEKEQRFPLVKEIKQIDFISTVEIKDIQFCNSLKAELDEGEAEAITLAIENRAELIILDELAGRNIAQFQKLSFIGSIGCLVLAKRKNIITYIKPLLDSMRKDARFWINDKLYQRVLLDNEE